MTDQHGISGGEDIARVYDRALYYTSVALYYTQATSR